MGIFDNTRIPVLNKALDVYSARQKVTAENIANVNTPGYRSKKVLFEERLAGAMGMATSRSGGAHPNHISLGSGTVRTVEPEIQENATSSESNDDYASGANDVDIDVQMAELAKNQIRFKFASRMLGDAFRGIQKSIRGQA